MKIIRYFWKKIQKKTEVKRRGKKSQSFSYYPKSSAATFRCIFFQAFKRFGFQDSALFKKQLTPCQCLPHQIQSKPYKTTQRGVSREKSLSYALPGHVDSLGTLAFHGPF